MLKKVNKNHVKSKIRNSGQWTGFIAPDKVGIYHVNSGWHIGMRVTFESVAQLENTISQFAYYNCNYELGYRVAYWESP